MRRMKALGVVLFLLLWMVLSIVIQPMFLPMPHTVFVQLCHAVGTSSFWLDVGTTLYRLSIGFGVGACLGVAVGLLVGSSRVVHTLSEFVIDFFRSVPGTSLFPLFLLIFGLGDASKWGIAAYSAFLISLFNTAYGVKHSSKTRTLVARTMRATRSQLFLKVVLPEALPHVVVGLRLAVSSALIYIVVSEMFMGTTSGLGYRIYNANVLFQVREMYSSILVAGLIGYSLNQILVALERRFVHWAGK
ncbi:MAG: ABC transporter permease [Planctomycetes bacterium]|nr:ABC transporter permease [Planctomycetota bacterium]